VSRTSLRGLVALALLCAVSIGCQAKRKEIPAEETRIKSLALLYGRYVSRNKGQAPANVEALKKFAKGLSADELSAHPGGMNSLMADGSVRNIGYSVSAATFNALGTRNGGEVINANSY
jgi:prepilin-type processing-associated H-X9-DG protein